MFYLRVRTKVKQKIQNGFGVGFGASGSFCGGGFERIVDIKRKFNIGVDVKELAKAREELAELFDKLQFVLRGKNRRAMQDVVCDKSFNMLWEQIRKENVLDNLEVKKRSDVGLAFLLIEGICELGVYGCYGNSFINVLREQMNMFNTSKVT